MTDDGVDASGSDDASGAAGSNGVLPNGIRAVGTYAPRNRLPASEIESAWGSVDAPGIDQKAVPAADEDALTMAYEAARNALDADGTAGSRIDRLLFATTTPPVDDEALTARLGSMLGIQETAATETFGGSTRAGTTALLAALSRPLAADAVVLVVAADCPRGELNDAADQAAGAGAAAYVVVPDGPTTVLGPGTYTTPYPGTRFREAGTDRTRGLGITTYDREAYRETLAGAVTDLQSTLEAGALQASTADPDETDGQPADAFAKGIDAAAIQAPDGARPYRAADSLEVETEAIQKVATVQKIGDTGAASPLLGLAIALDDPAVDRTLVAGYGSGGSADAFLVDAPDPIPARLAVDRGNETEITYTRYLRVRDEITSGPPDGGGAYVSIPSWRCTLPQRHRLVAGRCVDCGALTFPPEGACSACGSRNGYDDVELPGTGEVEAVTAISQGGAPPEFDQQQQRSGDYGVVVVSFDGQEPDESVSAPAQVCDDATDDVTLAVGDRVATTIRRIYTQEGVTRYGFKVRPTSTG